MQPKNFLQIKAFRGEKYDTELGKITPFLLHLAEEKDVRPVSEKYSQFFKIDALLLDQTSLERPSQDPFFQTLSPTAEKIKHRHEVIKSRDSKNYDIRA